MLTGSALNGKLFGARVALFQH